MSAGSEAGEDTRGQTICHLLPTPKRRLYEATLCVCVFIIHSIKRVSSSLRDCHLSPTSFINFLTLDNLQYVFDIIIRL